MGRSPDRAATARLLVVVGMAVTLAAAAPHPPVTPGALAGWLAQAPPDDALAGLAALAAEGCLAWVLLAAALVCLTRLPGFTGQIAGRLTARVLPATVRRCLEALLGISVAAVPVIAPVGPWVGAAMADQPRPAPTWSAPSLDRPVVSPPRTSRARPIRSTGYVVRTGDCLWTIAAQHTRSRSSSVDIAATWPQWYAANERVIGPNPNLIRPGQHLAVPTEAREVSS